MNATRTRTLVPVEDMIVVAAEAVRTQSDGGIILPDAAQERPVRGTVLAVGPGKTLEDGSNAAMPRLIEAGATIVYGRYSGTEVELDGQEYVVMHVRDVLGIVKDHA
jgi:chaperonin GroES